MKKLLILVSVVFLSACGGGDGNTVYVPGSAGNTVNVPVSADTVAKAPLQISIVNGVAKTVANVPTSEKVKIVISNATPGRFQGFKIMTTASTLVTVTWNPSVPQTTGYKVDAIFFRNDGVYKRITKYATSSGIDVGASGGSVILTANSFSNPLSPSYIRFDTTPAVQLGYTTAFRANIRLPKNKTPFTAGYVYVDNNNFTTMKTPSYVNYTGTTLKVADAIYPSMLTSSQNVYFQWVFIVDPFYLNTAVDGQANTWTYHLNNPVNNATAGNWSEADLFRYVLIPSAPIGGGGGIIINPGI